MIRRSKYRQSECSSNKTLDYIESAAGLFHMQMAVLVMLFRVHFGCEAEPCSLSRWIKDRKRSQNKLWNHDRQLVKDFRRCQEFFDIVLDGYLLATMINYCNFESTEEMKHNFGKVDVEYMIDNLSDFLVKFHIVHGNRAQEHGQDRAHDNLILFMQQGLVLRNFSLGMRQGDPGRALISLSYFTIWFQASKQSNYARETLHLTACLKRIWSPKLVEFYKRNMLLNLSGKAEGWMACDQVNKYVV